MTLSAISLGSTTGTPSSGTNSLSITTTTSVPAGSLIVGLAGLNYGTGGSVTAFNDTVSNSYSKIVAASEAGGFDVELWAALTVTALPSGDTISFNSSESGGFGPSAVQAAYFPLGNGRISAADVSNSATFSSSTSPTVASGTLSQPYELIFGGIESYLNTGDAITESANFTALIASGVSFASSKGVLNLAFYVVNSASSVSYSPTVTGGASNIVIASFKIIPFAGLNMPMLGL